MPSIKDDLPKRPVWFEIAAGAAIALLCLRGASSAQEPTARTPGPFDAWRTGIVVRVDDVFDPPSSHWVAGLLLGVDDGFSKKWIQAFRRTGTSHLTAVSGYNVGLVMIGIQSLLLRLPIRRATRMITALLAIGGFVALTGSPGSVLRAAVMVTAVEAGRHLGRPVRPMRALLFAALAIGLVSPRSLIRDRGFQLSVLAAFGLVTIAQPLQEMLFRRWPKALGEWASQTLAASVTTAPLIAWMAGSYSLVTLPANVAVAAFVPPIMAAGALLLTVSLASLPLARLLAGAGEGLFLLPLVIIRGLASWPAASVNGWTAALVLIAAQMVSLILILRWRRRASSRYGIQT